VKAGEFIDILEADGFVLDRQRSTHKQFKGAVSGKSCLVTVDCAHRGDDISPRNLAAMIRQSGLSKKLFRR